MASLGLGVRVVSWHFNMDEALRTSSEDPIYLHPSFAEAVMGFPIGWGVLKDAETASPQSKSK